MGQPIYESTWDATSKKTWGQLLNHQWQDFALVVFECDSEAEGQGAQVERGQVDLSQVTGMSGQGALVEWMLRRILMTNDTEMSVAVFVSTINFYEMLLYFLPWYDRINETMIHNCRVIDIACRYLEEQMGRVDRNLDLERAIELLPYYERRLGIESNPRYSYEQRRNQIRAVLNLMYEQITEEAIVRLCSAFSNNDAGVEVTRTEEPYIFDIKFVARGLPNNMEELDRILRRVMPADLDWRYTYTQNPWEQIIKNKYRWRDVTETSWTKINEYKEG